MFRWAPVILESGIPLEEWDKLHGRLETAWKLAEAMGDSSLWFEYIDLAQSDPKYIEACERSARPRRGSAKGFRR